MEFTTSDLYNVVRWRKAHSRGSNELKFIIAAVIIPIVLTAVLDMPGMALGLILSGGIFIYLLRRRNRQDREDRDEAARLHTELPAELRAQEPRARE